jgi:hypothetical protein
MDISIQSRGPVRVFHTFGDEKEAYAAFANEPS